MSFEEEVWRVCRKIPKGKVSTYKEIANALHTKAYRAVGNALRKNPHAPTVPCHRVVKCDGSVGGYQGKKDSEKKIRLLKKESVEIKKGKIKDFENKLYIIDNL